MKASLKEVIEITGPKDLRGDKGYLRWEDGTEFEDIDCTADIARLAHSWNNLPRLLSAIKTAPKIQKAYTYANRAMTEYIELTDELRAIIKAAEEVEI